METRSIHFKSDFLVRLVNEVDWSTPFSIRFFTTRAVSAKVVAFDGENYVGCTLDESTGALLVPFERFTELYRQGLGTLRMELTYRLSNALYPDQYQDVVLPAQPVVCTNDQQEEFYLSLALTGDDDVEVSASVVAPFMVGPQGAAGTGISTMTQTSASVASAGANVWKMTLTDGREFSFTVLNGEKGDTGAQGPQGAKGAKGDQGAKGDTGARGPQGEQGPRGVPGQRGEKGAKGDKGDRGLTGETGPAGNTPEIGQNGNWWIGGIDTGVKADYSGTEAQRQATFEANEADRNQEFASKEATRDAANQAALDCAETLNALGPKIDRLDLAVNGGTKSVLDGEPDESRSNRVWFTVDTNIIKLGKDNTFKTNLPNTAIVIRAYKTKGGTVQDMKNVTSDNDGYVVYRHWTSSNYTYISVTSPSGTTLSAFFFESSPSLLDAVESLSESVTELSEDISEETTRATSAEQHIASSVEDNAARLTILEKETLSSDSQTIFNDPDNLGTWKNTIICGPTVVQKMDDALVGKLAYGIKFYQKYDTAEVLRIGLATCEDETISGNSQFSLYKYVDVTLSAENIGKILSVDFDNPILVLENSYMYVKKSPSGTSGNGASVTSYFAKDGTNVYVMPFGNVQFQTFSNSQLFFGIVVGKDSINTRITALENAGSVISADINNMRQDVIYGSEIFTERNGINYSNGAIIVSDDIFHTDFIPLNGAEFLSFPVAYDPNTPVGASFYDKDKNYIGGRGNMYGNAGYYYCKKYPIKELFPNAEYVIFNSARFMNNAIIEDIRLYKGKGEVVSDESINSYSRGASLWLPSTMYCLVGRTLQIFNRSVLRCTNVGNFSLSISVISGPNRFKSYPNMIEYSPVSGDADSIVTINAVNVLGEVIVSKAVTFKAVAVPTSPGAIKNILFVGDSWTQAIYPSEVARMLTGSPTEHQSNTSDCQWPSSLNLSNLNFIGTNNGGAYQTMPYREGASGKTLAYHLGEESPFYINGEINFTAYMNSGNVHGTIADPSTDDKIDICLMIHGRNAVPKFSLIETFIQKLRAHNPNVIILIGYDIISAINSQSAMFGQSFTFTFERLFENFIMTKYEGVYLLPVQTGLDTRYNMVYNEQPANYRNTKFTEVMNNTANTMHPNNNGYCQIADEVFYELCNFI